MTNMKLAFIGGGAMCEAIIIGALKANFIKPENIFVGDHTIARREYLETNYKVNTFADNTQAIKDADYVVLSIKPQYFKEVMNEKVVEKINKRTTIISIMGSVDLNTIENLIPQKPIVRVMPNTPLAIGSGISALAKNKLVHDKDFEFAKDLFACAGEIVVVDEKYMEAITAVSGCGPGYVFVLIDALADAGVNAGLPRDMAIKLAAATFAGAGKMVIETGKHPAVLRDQVTSPGGTTIAGIYELEKSGVRAAMYDAVNAVLTKSEKLKGK